MTVTEKLKLRLKAALRTRREFDEFLDILFSSFSGGGGNYTVEYHTITPANVASKSVLLNNEPADSSQVEVTVLGGPDQFFSIDFGMTAGTKGNNRVVFTGYNLNSLIESGDIVKVTYNIKSEEEGV